MKLKLAMFSLMGALALHASAQNDGARNTRTAFEKSTSHNWFIVLQGGASALGNGYNDHVKLGDRLFFTPSLSVGKWHTPYYATRLKVQAGEAVSFLDPAVSSTADQTLKNYFIGGHYDFMLNLTNFFGRNDKSYFFNVIPFVGLGYEYKFDSSLKQSYSNTVGPKHVHAATATAGLQLAMRLAKRVNFVLEGEATWNGLNLSESYPTGYANNLRYTASAGLAFRLGKVGFTGARLHDEALEADLMSRINALRAENAELSKRPTHCPEVAMAPVQATPSHFLAEKSVLFSHGKSTVSKDQLITIFDAAEFVNKHQGQIIVTGYTQSSESRFKGLAEKRAQAVAKVLTEQYNVPSEHITVEYKSATEAPFTGKSTAWNRVVIIRSK